MTCGCLWPAHVLPFNPPSHLAGGRIFPRPAGHAAAWPATGSCRPHALCTTRRAAASDGCAAARHGCLSCYSVTQHRLLLYPLPTPWSDVMQLYMLWLILLCL